LKRLIVFIIMASAGTALAGHFTDHYWICLWPSAKPLQNS